MHDPFQMGEIELSTGGGSGTGSKGSVKDIRMVGYLSQGGEEQDSAGADLAAQDQLEQTWHFRADFWYKVGRAQIPCHLFLV